MARRDATVEVEQIPAFAAHHPSRLLKNVS
jgi:hypothetical protein